MTGAQLSVHIVDTRYYTQATTRVRVIDIAWNKNTIYQAFLLHKSMEVLYLFSHFNWSVEPSAFLSVMYIKDIISIFYLYLPYVKTKSHKSFPLHDVGLCTATIALFTELKIVVEMINLGVLLVFYLVANALIYRKYVMISHNPPSHTFMFLFLLSSCALGFSISWQFHQQWWNLSIFGGSMIIITALFQYMVPCLRQDTEWSVPFMPWPAAMSVFLNVFLMSTLKMSAFQTFGIWACLITLFYVLYGVHSTYKAEEFEMGVNEVNPNSSILLPKVDIQVIWIKNVQPEKKQSIEHFEFCKFSTFFFSLISFEAVILV